MYKNASNVKNLRYLLRFIVVLQVFQAFSFSKANNEIMSTDPTEDTMKLFAEKSKMFAFDMMNALRTLKPVENVVFSPFSVQTCAAMARVGATGETANELSNGLRLISTDIDRMADSFNGLLSQYLNDEILKIANKIYIMEGYKVKKSYNEILSKKFFTTADELNFARSTEAANIMNNWVELNTNNLIKNLISPNVIGVDTRLVLLNAIHFKGEWVHKFRETRTHEEDFYLNDIDTVKVQMMSQKERFAYAELPELDCVALEMPYKNTDLSMLIMLPNSRTGLSKLLEKLQNVALSEITGKLSKTQVLVKIPKFKAEFEIELSDAFKKMGMTRIFSSSAEFNEMLESPEPLMISKIIHKAFIDVNEDGTEAAAATAVLMMRCSMAIFEDPPKEFIANRPFFYILKDKNHIVFFAGKFNRL